MTPEEKNNELNQTLGNRLDQFNAALAQAEAKLCAMKVPCDVWLCVDSTPDDPDNEYNCTYESVGIAKVAGGWRLCYGHGSQYNGQPDEFEFKPIGEASISERQQAARNIEKLRQQILKTKEELISSLEIDTKRLIEAVQKMP